MLLNLLRGIVLLRLWLRLIDAQSRHRERSRHCSLANCLLLLRLLPLGLQLLGEKVDGLAEGLLLLSGLQLGGQSTDRVDHACGLVAMYLLVCIGVNI